MQGEKRMKKVLILAFISIILLVSFVSATTTEINVKTLSNHQVYIAVQDYSTHTLVISKILDSGIEGKVTTSLDTGSQSKIDIVINVKKDGEKIVDPYRYDDWKNGEPVYLCLDADDIDDDCEDAFIVEEIVNETSNETSNETAAASDSSAETEESSSALTGFVSFVKDKLLNKTSYYILGTIAVAILGFFLVRKGIPYMRNRAVFSQPSYPSDKSKPSSFVSADVLNLEKKLQAVQIELNRVKNQDKIARAEKRLAQERAELDRMKKGF